MIDEKNTTKIPTKQDPYIFKSVTCDHEAEASWNKDTWSLSINNLTMSGTTCTLSFMKYGFESLVFVIQSDAKNVEELMSNNTNIENIVKNEDAMKIIASEENLRNEILNSEKYTTALAKKFLNSTVLTEEEKYNAGLPCYLYKNGKNIVGGFLSKSYYGNNLAVESPSLTGSKETGSSYSMYASYGNSYVTAISNKKLNTKNYKYLEMYSNHSSNASNLTGTNTLGFGENQEINSFQISNSENYNSSASNTTLVTNISNYNEEAYLKIKTKQGGQSSVNTVTTNIYTIAIY